MIEPRQRIYDTYWYYAYERQEIFIKKLKGNIDILSLNPIFQQYKFCNTYRINDRVSQFLVKNVIYSYKGNEQDNLLRIILFRLLNNIETWQELEKQLGEDISYRNFNFSVYCKLLEIIKNKNSVIYGNAFILCANKYFNYEEKHKNHLALLNYIFQNNKYINILNSKRLKELYENLLELPLIGKFMAYQIAIDLNYSELFDFSENDFTVAGPGAERGINKCFESVAKKDNTYIIHYMVENQEREFERLRLPFTNLYGRTLKAIDCQGLFCETDKYCRVKFPELKSNRSKIKSKYTKTDLAISFFYPPKWKLNNLSNKNI